jgi:aminoglycoside 6'-N-acetyltransferase I
MNSHFDVTRLASDNSGGKDAYIAFRCMLWPELTDLESRAEAEEMLRRNGVAALLARSSDGAYIGFAEVGTREYAEGASTSPVGYLEGWFVLPEWRRRGVGRALVRAAEEWAKSRGCSEFASDVVLANEVSIAAHGRLGFEETERLVCFLKPID